MLSEVKINHRLRRMDRKVERWPRRLQFLPSLERVRCAITFSGDSSSLSGAWLSWCCGWSRQQMQNQSPSGMMWLRRGSQQTWQQQKSQPSQMSRTCSLSPPPHQQQVQQSYSLVSTNSFDYTVTFSVCLMTPPSPSASLRMQLKGLRQHGHMVDVFRHSSMQSKQNQCWQGRLPRMVLQRLRQMGHIDSKRHPCLLVIYAVFSRCLCADAVCSILSGVLEAACSMDCVSSSLHS